MAVLLVSDYGEDPEVWRRALSNRVPEVELRDDPHHAPRRIAGLE